MTPTFPNTPPQSTSTAIVCTSRNIRRRRRFDENLARTRLRELTRAAGEVLEIPRERIAVKTRKRGKGRREVWTIRRAP